MNPYGGTEIQLEYLHKYVSKELLDKVNITTSIPEKTPLQIEKQIYFGYIIVTINLIFILGSRIN
jgi:hypothetical protein